MQRTSKSRLAGGAAGLLLIGATLLSTTGVALAATTRFLYVGSDPGFAADNGILGFTPVTAGGSSVTNVFVKNIDNQTLTHVVLTFGRSQGALSLSDVVFGANGSSCSASATTITCDLGNLKAKQSRSFSLIVDAGAGGTAGFAGKVVFNESNNPNGGNQQINDITGSIDVGAATCNSLATFLPPGIAKTLLPDDGSACSSDLQRSSLTVPARPNGNNVVQLGDGTLATACTAGFSSSSARLGDRQWRRGRLALPDVDDLLRQLRVIGSINPDKVAFDHDGVVIPAGKKGICKTSSSTNCIESVTTSATGVTFVVRTPSNGLIKGMH